MLIDNSPGDDGGYFSLGYMEGDQDKPLIPCGCRACESEGFYESGPDCLYYNYDYGSAP